MAAAVTANPAIAAAVNSAVLPLSSLWSSIAGMFSSVGAGGALAAVALLAPGAAAAIIAWCGVAFMIVSALAHGYALITGVTATNNATIALVENVLNTIDTGLGGKGFSFPNDPAAA
jgi:hypothetical protein